MIILLERNPFATASAYCSKSRSFQVFQTPLVHYPAADLVPSPHHDRTRYFWYETRKSSSRDSFLSTVVSSFLFACSALHSRLAASAANCRVSEKYWNPTPTGSTA